MSESATIQISMDLSGLTPEQIGVALANLPSDEWVRVFQAVADEGERWKEEAKRTRGESAFCIPSITWMDAGDRIADADTYGAQDVLENLGYKLSEWKLGQLRRESKCSMFHFNRDCPACGWRASR